MRNQITRALGYEAQIEIDFFEIDIYRDDIWLFCTDGLTQKVTSDELLSMLANADDPDKILKNMVALANQRGGKIISLPLLFRFKACGIKSWMMREQIPNE